MKTHAFAATCLSLLCATVLSAQSTETIPFLALMQPGNETPAIADSSSGNAIIWLHVIRDAAGAITSGSVDFDISTKFSSAVTATGLHIHNAAAGVAGPIVVPTDIGAGDKSIAVDATGRIRIQKQVQFPLASPSPLSLTVINDMVANPQNYYVNIHTTDRPGGAMRGQLLRAEMKIMMGMMSSANENPPVPLPVSGVATVTHMRAVDSKGAVALAASVFNLEYTGFDAGTIFTGFHIHSSPAGVNGPVIINTGLSGTNTAKPDPSGAGNLNYVIPMSPLDTSFAAEVAAVNGLFDNPINYYINIHTTSFGGGIMRDQLHNTEKSVFQVNMLPSNETPAVTGLDASARAAIPLYLLRNDDGTVLAGTAVFDVNFRGFPAGTTITGLHVHAAAAGVAGGIVIPTDVNSLANKIVSDTGSGNIFKTVTIASAAGVAALNNLVQNPAGFYANMHTTTNPGGAIRSQLGGDLGKPAVKSLSSLASSFTSVAPGSILSIFGDNLAPLTSNTNGFYSGKSLATSLDGVSVTIGGAKAPLYLVSPGQINVQVPLELTAVGQPLVVTTPAGASAPIGVNLAATAPVIPILDSASGLGAVVKNSDYSLITAANPARTGDVIVIYSTGLGQTTPAMKTGVPLPASGGFSSTAPVTVQIGTQNATVLYSIGSPGFAGLYQTAVTVPSGVTGTVPVVLKTGSTSSNPASITVR